MSSGHVGDEHIMAFFDYDRRVAAFCDALFILSFAAKSIVHQRFSLSAFLRAPHSLYSCVPIATFHDDIEHDAQNFAAKNATVLPRAAHNEKSHVPYGFFLFSEMSQPHNCCCQQS
jgi:hypothetical protein